MKAVSVKTMRESDAYTIENLVSSKELMRRAGESIFKAAEWKAPVAIVCGKGNNAGDGYVVASYLKDAGIDCTIILLSDSYSVDGRYYFDHAVMKGVPIRIYDKFFDFSEYGSILDCILGTGFKGDVEGVLAEAIEKINKSGAYVVSADINSGLNGDTGTGNLYVRSDLTVSIGDFKTGHFWGDAAKAMKSKVNVDIGIKIIGPYVDVEDETSR